MLSRSAFICNICFLLAIGILWMRHPVNPGLASLIIVMGFVLSIILNLIVNFGLAIGLLRRKKITAIPRALIFLNAGFLIVQLIMLIK